MFTWVAQKLTGNEEVPIIIEEDPDLDNIAATEEIDDVAKEHYEQAMSLAKKGDLRGASKSFQNLMHTFSGSPYSRKAKKKLKLIKERLEKVGKKKELSETEKNWKLLEKRIEDFHS